MTKLKDLYNYIPSYDAQSGEMWLVLPMKNLSSRNRAILATRNLMFEATDEQNTTKKQIGGTMNYATYLQEGGQASSKKDQLKALVIEALQNAGSEEEVNNIMSQLQEMAGLDQDAAQVLQEIMEEMQTQSMKCGGKVRAKIKKTKKCETGDTLTKDLKNILMAAKCGGKAKKTKKCAEGGELTLDFSIIDFAKCGKKLQKKEVGGKVAEEKCGGKAKKVKKAELGAPHGIKKEWKDSSYSVTNFSKGGCPCQLKKVGGKIITVDSCTGLPMKKNGGDLIKKYENTPGPITYNKNARLGRNYTYNGLEYEYSPATKTWSGFDPNKKGVLSTLSSGDLYNRLNDARNFYTKSNGSEYLKNDDGTYSKYGSDAVYRLMSANGKNYYTTGGNGATWNGSAWLKNGQTMTIDEKGNISWTGNPNTWTDAKGNVYTKGTDGYYTSNLADLNGYKFQLTSDGNFMRGNWGANDAVWDSAINNWKREGYDLTTKGRKTILSENAENNSNSGAGSTGLTAGQKLFLNNGAKELGDMTASQRKDWMLSGAGKDYIASLGDKLGFDVNSYTGTAAQNHQLLNAYKGYADWQTKLQPYAGLSDHHAEVMRNFDALHNYAPGAMTEAAQGARSLYQGANNGVLTDEQIALIDGAQSLYLSNLDYQRWMKAKRLQFSATPDPYAGMTDNLKAIKMAYDQNNGLLTNQQVMDFVRNGAGRMYLTQDDIDRYDRLNAAESKYNSDLWANQVKSSYARKTPLGLRLYMKRNAPVNPLTNEVLGQTSFLTKGRIISYANYLK